MMTETADRESPERESRRGPNWDDPSIPAGDSPPLPGWPVWLSAAAWGAWLIYLSTIALA